MSRKWRRTLLMCGLLTIAAPAAPVVHGQQPKPADEAFVPIDQLPPEEQLPAAPLLIAAYAAVWLGVAGYVFSIWQRLGRVDREIAEVKRRIESASAARTRGGAG